MNLLERIHALFHEDIRSIDLNPLRVHLIPVFRNKLFLSKKDYMIPDKPQREGEKELIKISETAKREGHWTYFKDTDYWIHPAGKTIEIADSKGVGMGFEPKFYADLNVMEELGAGRKAVEYHIHPDCFVDFYLKHHPEEKREDVTRNWYKTALLPYPSEYDLKNSLEFSDREHKIATPLGITSYKLHDPKLTEEEGEFLDLVTECYTRTLEMPPDPRINNTRITLAEGFTQELIETINRMLAGQATLEYTPKSKL